MTSDEFDLRRAYSVRTPEDNRRLYADWAATYDDGFIASHGYVQHEAVVDAFLRRPHAPGSVLDVGCGTGVVGIELRRRGVAVVDGVDLSPEMLEIAATKRSSDAEAVYRNLIAADLTDSVAIDDTTFAGIVSAGAFTHGHLGPEPLGELLRIARPGAVFAIAINADHYENAGFAAWFELAESEGRVRDLEIVVSPVYDPDRYRANDAEEHAGTLSSVALFNRI
jgi:SAM-dependent methyltransferase